MQNNWPDNADGDVFRRLFAEGFDFSKPHVIDFNVDFDRWPPDPHAINLIKAAFPAVTVCEDSVSGDGYVLFKLNSLLTYDFVMETQAKATSFVAHLGGKCDSWGLLHE